MYENKNSVVGVPGYIGNRGSSAETRGVSSSPALCRDDWMHYYLCEVEPMIESTSMSQLLRVVLEEDVFWAAPAAKGMHHNFRGGLQDHVMRMLTLFVAMHGSGHPDFRGMCRGLVIAGIVMHDFMKHKEYVEGPPGEFSRTRYSYLVGHVAGGAMYAQKILDTAVPKIHMPEELKQHLFHVLLAHHGEVAWGSPVPPRTLEALVVHHIDNLDGSMWAFVATEDMQIRHKNTGTVIKYGGQA